VTKVDGAGAGIAGGPMKYRIRIRDERTGGSKEGTPEMYIGDPDGLAVQLQDTTYCGGSGPMGEVCLNPVIPAPSRGSIELVDFTHVGLFVSDVERSKSFYRDLFGSVPFLSIAQGAPKISVFGLKARNFDPAKAAAAITAAGGSVAARADASLSSTDPDGIPLQIKQA
jgi:Bleomycin resistance protein-like N-terminal